MLCIRCGKQNDRSMGVCQDCASEANTPFRSSRVPTPTTTKRIAIEIPSWVMYVTFFSVIGSLAYWKHVRTAQELTRLSRTEWTAPTQPIQGSTSRQAWQLGDLRITPLATYDITAQVLLRETFFWDAGSTLSPLDLTLAWGPMSTSESRKGIKFGRGYRSYNWRSVAGLEVSQRLVNDNVANVHMVPASEKIKEQLLDVRVGEVVRLRGFLIRADRADGWHWVSSTSRTDSGNGACELLWVEAVQS